MRVTDLQLARLSDSINTLMGTQLVSYENGKWNIDNYHLGYSYGNVSLYKVTSEGGSVSSIYGPSSKKELYLFLQGFTQGISLGKSLTR